MKPVYTVAGAIALALIMLAGWSVMRPSAQTVQAVQPTKAAVAALPTTLVEALQPKAEPLQKETPVAPDPALQQLIAAVRAGDAETVSTLLAAGVDIDTVGSAAHVLLPIAAKEGYLEIAQLLLDAGADVHSTMDGQKPGGAPLIQASALQYAASWGHLDVAELLLARGADPNQAEHRLGDVPLHDAAWFNRADIVQVLLDNGAVVDQRRMVDGMTPLHLAANNSSVEAAEALLEAGADVNLVEDQAGRPALNIALTSNRVTLINDTVRLLLDAGADVNIASDWGTTPLMTAVITFAPGRGDRVRWLLEAGADPDRQDMGGKTALHLAARWDNREAVELLIAHGAALDIPNIEGKTAMDVAANDEIRDMLRAAGAGDS